MALWYSENSDGEVRHSLRVERVLYRRRSEHQLVEVLETPRWGRVLVLDGIFQTSVLDEYHYHEMLVHPALTSAPTIERVLIIGGGDGGTAREVLRHAGVRQVVMIEIDPLVVEASRTHLPEIGPAWDDPRLDLRFQDGVSWVRESDSAAFDVILLDGSDPVGPSRGLFDAEFHRSCRSLLTKSGIFGCQSESPIFTPDLFRDVVTTCRTTFGSARPALGPAPIYAAGIWSWTFASAESDPSVPLPGRAEAIEAGCRHYNRDLHAAAFVLPNFVKALLDGTSKVSAGSPSDG